MAAVTIRNGPLPGAAEGNNLPPPEDWINSILDFAQRDVNTAARMDRLRIRNSAVAAQPMASVRRRGKNAYEIRLELGKDPE